MTSPRHASGLLVGLLVGVAACDDVVAPSLSSTVIDRFLEEQLLSEPEWHVRGRLQSVQAVIFEASFGDRFPCSSPGPAAICRTGGGVGLQLDHRVGWLYVGAPDGQIDPSSLLDFNASEPLLYDPALWSEMRAVDELVYQQHFKSRLVDDPDVPLGPLRRVAHELSDWIAPWLADALLDHRRAGRDCEVLNNIAQLPVFTGDAYAESRARAERLLLEWCEP